MALPVCVRLTYTHTLRPWNSSTELLLSSIAKHLNSKSTNSLEPSNKKAGTIYYVHADTHTYTHRGHTENFFRCNSNMTQVQRWAIDVGARGVCLSVCIPSEITESRPAVKSYFLMHYRNTHIPDSTHSKNGRLGATIPLSNRHTRTCTKCTCVNKIAL